MPRKPSRRKPAKDTDVFVTPDNELTVIQHVLACREEADNARKGRLKKNQMNRDVFMGEQDWTYKQPGQSTEFLPKLPMAVEQFSAFIKRALTQFGDWFSIELSKGTPQVLAPDQIRDLLKVYLEKVVTTNNRRVPFSNLLTDTIKSGLLEAKMILKVHGFMDTETSFVVEPGEPIVDPTTFQVTQESVLKAKDHKVWRPRIDLIRSEDYLPDPTGRGLYKIHEVERDFHEVVAMAEAGIYDLEIVNQIHEDFEKEADQKRTERERAQSEATPPRFRRRIVISEYWGSLLDNDGRIAHRNIVCALANKKYLIRKPETNPFWHGDDPFVDSSILRVPHSVWHKALYDHASSLNIALNEIFNLMLDGGIAQVWGIKQIRMDDLADPSQVSGGIPQGVTLAVKSTLPYNAKVIEQVSEGEVPPDAKAIFEMLNSEFAQASLSNELKLGGFPQRNVKATEVVEQSQSQAVTLDSIASDIENELVSELLRKLWLVILQNADDLEQEDIVAAVGPQTALVMSRMTPQERFSLFAKSVTFKVFGLSATLGKARDFQKLMALLQVVSTNPILLQEFFTRYSPNKALSMAMRALNINPTHLERDEQEQARIGEDFQKLMVFFNMAQGGANPNTGSIAPNAGKTGEAQMPAEINQLVNPATGFTANG